MLGLITRNRGCVYHAFSFMVNHPCAPPPGGFLSDRYSPCQRHMSGIRGNKHKTFLSVLNCLRQYVGRERQLGNRACRHATKSLTVKGCSKRHAALSPSQGGKAPSSGKPTNRSWSTLHCASKIFQSGPLIARNSAGASFTQSAYGQLQTALEKCQPGGVDFCRFKLTLKVNGALQHLGQFLHVFRRVSSLQ